MESIVKKKNKENARPVGAKKQTVSTTVPKQKIVKSATWLKNEPRETLSQVPTTQQVQRQNKLTGEIQKAGHLPASRPGTYKGRVVQSKIDCFRKPSADVKTTTKTVVSKPEVTTTKPKERSKSVATLTASPKLKSRSKSVSGAPQNPTVNTQRSQKQIPPKVAASKPGAHQACFNPRPAPPATGRWARPVASKKAAPPKPATAELKACRPLTATVSKYRVQVESTEEKRAKLADWLASKGRTLKRPPITNKLSGYSRKLAPQSETKSLAASETATQTGAAKTTLVTMTDNKTTRNPPTDVPKVTQLSHSGTSSNIMDTTLDHLNDSEVDTDIQLESLVMNLCDKLEAMEGPSSCRDEEELVENVQTKEVKVDAVYEILEEDKLVNEEESENGSLTKNTIVLNAYETDDPGSAKNKIEGNIDVDEDLHEASVVKYNVKTTPYLQTIKNRIECKTAPGGGTRQKSTIKDLKFLTPVRRSTRIHRKSSRLPDMLNDHDACVSSLAELVQMDDAEANAYIYRKNPALLDCFPDQLGDIQSICK